MRRALVLAFVVALPCSAWAAPFRIRIDGKGFPNRIGSLNVARHPHLAAASKLFGTPTSRSSNKNICTVRWKPLRLKVVFTSFGAVGSICKHGFFQTAVIKSKRFVTWRGIRVGTRSSRVKQLQPSARFRHGKWILATQSVFGPKPAPTVEAFVHGGRVTSLRLFVGAAGD